MKTQIDNTVFASARVASEEFFFGVEFTSTAGDFRTTVIAEDTEEGDAFIEFMDSFEV